MIGNDKGEVGEKWSAMLAFASSTRLGIEALRYSYAYSTVQCIMYVGWMQGLYILK